ncbi:MAG TPA: hypothetical protein VGR35_13475 [Tepidisphaeraceae bacterium]|nr:hypothetical protein [Tepidisphaeraceae bacterium]
MAGRFVVAQAGAPLFARSSAVTALRMGIYPSVSRDWVRFVISSVRRTFPHILGIWASILQRADFQAVTTTRRNARLLLHPLVRNRDDNRAPARPFLPKIAKKFFGFS